MVCCLTLPAQLLAHAGNDLVLFTVGAAVLTAVPGVTQMRQYMCPGRSLTQASLTGTFSAVMSKNTLGYRCPRQRQHLQGVGWLCTDTGLHFPFTHSGPGVCLCRPSGPGPFREESGLCSCRGLGSWDPAGQVTQDFH